MNRTRLLAAAAVWVLLRTDSKPGVTARVARAVLDRDGTAFAACPPPALTTRPWCETRRGCETRPGCGASRTTAATPPTLTAAVASSDAVANSFVPNARPVVLPAG